MMKLTTTACVLELILLSGCANLHPTPPAVKLQAAQSIALISGLESALKTYRTEEAASANYLIAITSDLKSSNASNKRILGDNQVALVASGNAQSLAVQSKLKVALDGLASNALSGPTFNDYVSAGQKLVTPPENFTEEATAVQAALAELTKELPTKVAVAEWKATAKTFASSAKDLSKKVNDAKTPATP